MKNRKRSHDLPIPTHVKFRQKTKRFFDDFLRKLSNPKSNITIAKNEVERILVVRINYRIGNMLFTTPMIQQLQREFPKAKIDIIVGAPFTKVLFSGFANVENIYDFSRELLKHPLRMFRYIRELRQNNYDVVININGGSTSDRIATALAKSKYKVAFCSEHNYTPANLCVERKDMHINHEALIPLELMKIFGVQPDYTIKMNIALSDEELREGREALREIIGENKGRVIGIFRNARHDKLIEDAWWQKFVQELRTYDENLIFVDILSPDIPYKLDASMYEYSEKNLRKLAAFMANLDAFICGDTGPMHLASASGVATIALFKVTLPLLYGTLKENDLSLVMKDKNISDVAREVYEHMEKITQ
jgi:ADP-heptose:LPS heptosyltransferase